jgi:hypothetical protein
MTKMDNNNNITIIVTVIKCILWFTTKKAELLLKKIVRVLLDNYIRVHQILMVILNDRDIYF